MVRGRVKLAFHCMTWSGLEVYLFFGAIYEEFLLQNKDLVGHNKYPATLVKLLRIHAELCEFHKVNRIYYDLWLDPFYRE